MKNKSSLILFVILLLALGLRLAGISHGFPFIFHPDEPTVINSALGLRFDLNPHHFDWPHLYIYVNYFIYMVFAKFRDWAVLFGFKDIITTNFPIIFDDNLIFYLITRTLSAVLGAFTIIPIFKAGQALFNEKVGVFAALTFAVIPFHVWHSHYSLIDVPMVFLISWGLYFCARILADKDPIDYAGAGFYIGLGASTKYNGGLTALSVPLAHFIRILKNKDESIISGIGILNLSVAVFMAVLGFVLGTPFSVLDFDTFIRTDGPKGALWQFTNVGSLPLNVRLSNFLYEIVYDLPNNLGYTILIIFVVTVFYILIKFLLRVASKYDYNALFLAISGLFCIFYISGFEKTRAHYYMIAYPYIAILSSYLLYTIYEKIPSKIKVAIILPLIIFYYIPFYFSVQNALRFYNGDTRNILHTWISLNTVKNQTVFYNNREMDSVFKLNSDKILSKRGTENLNFYNYDYIVLSYSSDKELIEDKSESPSALKGYDQIFTVNSKEFLGPNITIFKKSQ